MLVLGMLSVPVKVIGQKLLPDINSSGAKWTVEGTAGFENSPGLKWRVYREDIQIFSCRLVLAPILLLPKIG